MSLLLALTGGGGGLTADAVDSVVFSDSAVSFTAQVAIGQDSLVFSDSAAASRLGSVAAVGVDSVTFSDSAVSFTSRLSVGVDSVTFSDSGVAAIGSGNVFAVASDSIVFNDSAVAARSGPIIPQAPTGGSGAADRRERVRKEDFRKEFLEIIDRIEGKVKLPPAEKKRVQEVVQTVTRPRVELDPAPLQQAIDLAIQNITKIVEEETRRQIAVRRREEDDILMLL